MTGITEELEGLRRENARLRKLLNLTEAEAAPAQGTQVAWFEKSPGPVSAGSSPQDKVALYAALFGARRDVYAVRWENARFGKSGWVPAVAGGWRKGSKAEDQRYLPLTSEVLASHLTGDSHIGLYPMLPGDKTSWLAPTSTGRRPCSTPWPISRRPGPSGPQQPWRYRGLGSGLTCGSFSPIRYRQ